jgi:hypothetical protein
MALKFVLILLFCLAMGGCLKGGFFTKKLASSKSGVKAEHVQILDGESGVVTATLDASSDLIQVIRVGGVSAVAGTELSFMPGTLAVDTDITIEEAVSLTSPALTAQLGVTEGIAGAGTAVSVQSSVGMDAMIPFTVSLSLPQVSTLAEGDVWANLIIIYKVDRAADGAVLAGIIPRAAISIVGGKASFQTSQFGLYQSVVTVAPVAGAKQVLLPNANVLTKREAAALPPMQILARRPFAVGAGDTVKLTGKNFRPSMLLAFNGHPAKISVASDTAATFVAPAYEGRGLALLSADGDGVAQTVTLLYKGTDNDVPVFSGPASDMCSGVKFYGASGALQTGTRACGAPVNCGSDGQVGCVTTATFPAANPAAINTWDLRYGKTFGGVTGQLKTNCRNTVNNASYNFDGAIGNLDDTAIATGTHPDFWDTSDDSHGLQGIIVDGWGAETHCDTDNFEDVTTLDGGSTQNTCGFGDVCIFRDKVTNLRFMAPSSKFSSVTWSQAVEACHSSTYGGYPATYWRLPTQKELFSLYEHGLVSLAGSGIGVEFGAVSAMASKFWTATTNVSNTANAWTVWLENGGVDNTNIRSLTINTAAICVH